MTRFMTLVAALAVACGVSFVGCEEKKPAPTTPPVTPPAAGAPEKPATPPVTPPKTEEKK